MQLPGILMVSIFINRWEKMPKYIISEDCEKLWNVFRYVFFIMHMTSVRLVSRPRSWFPDCRSNNMIAWYTVSSCSISELTLCQSQETGTPRISSDRPSHENRTKNNKTIDALHLQWKNLSGERIYTYIIDDKSPIILSILIITKYTK